MARDKRKNFIEWAISKGATKIRVEDKDGLVELELSQPATTPKIELLDSEAEDIKRTVDPEERRRKQQARMESLLYASS